MNLINLTPHKINIITETSEIEIQPSGKIARCSEKIEQAGMLDGIALIKKSLGDVQDLPDPAPDTYYIVSLPVFMAKQDRQDILTIGESIRDNNGNIIGCKSLSIH